MIFREGSNKASKGSPDITEGAGRGRDGHTPRWVKGTVRSFVRPKSEILRKITNPPHSCGQRRRRLRHEREEPIRFFFILCSGRGKQGDEGSEAVGRSGIHIFSTLHRHSAAMSGRLTMLCAGCVTSFEELTRSPRQVSGTLAK